MQFQCKTISLNIFNTLANQCSYQLIFSSSYQNKWDLPTFISEADRIQKFVDQWIYDFLTSSWNLRIQGSYKSTGIFRNERMMISCGDLFHQVLCNHGYGEYINIWATGFKIKRCGTPENWILNWRLNVIFTGCSDLYCKIRTVNANEVFQYAILS